MSARPDRQWGKTAPFSTNRPADKDLALNDALLAELRSQNSWENSARTSLRENTLKTLQGIATKFVAFIGQRKKIPQNIIDTAGGLIYPFGSYRLGVHGPGSDIDTLILGPKHVTRDDFFAHFPDFLLEHAAKGAISGMVVVTNTKAPIIKLTYSDIDLDLAYVSLQRSSVPHDLNILDDALMRNLDDTSVRSFNGVRVAAEILELIPQKKTFGYALRAIKLWAKRRAIDAAIVGYPGGIAWAIIVARICQLYPNACGSVIVAKMFYLIKIWKWSYQSPIELCDRKPTPPGGYQQWNPAQSKVDAAHLMPVITPAYPCMCTTHTVNRSTFSVIQRELERGEEIVNKIFSGEKTWNDLFATNAFFSSDYKYYLAVICSSTTKDGLKSWSGLVNARLRFLGMGIVNSPIDVDLAVPYTEGFHRVHQCRGKEQQEQVLQGNLSYQIKETTTATTKEIGEDKHDVDAVVTSESTENGSKELSNGTIQGSGEASLSSDEDQITTIYTTTFYIGLEIAKGCKTLDLGAITDEFKWGCTSKAEYDKDTMLLRVHLVKNWQLPDDVFKEGEQRPVKTSKSSRAVKSKKRTVNDAQLDDNVTEAARRKLSEVQGTNGGHVKVVKAES